MCVAFIISRSLDYEVITSFGAQTKTGQSITSLQETLTTVFIKREYVTFIKREYVTFQGCTFTGHFQGWCVTTYLFLAHLQISDLNSSVRCDPL